MCAGVEKSGKDSRLEEARRKSRGGNGEKCAKSGQMIEVNSKHHLLLGLAVLGLAVLGLAVLGLASFRDCKAGWKRW
jgi:hypothetical protein